MCLVQGDVALPETITKFLVSYESEFQGASLQALVHNAGLYVGITTEPTSDLANKASSSKQRILGMDSFSL